MFVRLFMFIPVGVYALVPALIRARIVVFVNQVRLTSADALAALLSQALGVAAADGFSVFFSSSIPSTISVPMIGDGEISAALTAAA